MIVKLGNIAATVVGKAKVKFDGETTASDKYYVANKSVNFEVGDRVLCIEVSGTYVIVCKI